jgi:membrane protein implicated in regulation of membrane protease activity
MSASLIGVGTGVALAALMYLILFVFVKEQASSLIPAESVLGCVGVVTTSIDKNAVGEVGVSAEGQYRNYAARATGPQSIEKGRRVRVVRMAGGDLIVEEVQG